LLSIFILLFFPTIQDWAIMGGTQWYRPFALWLATIVFFWWGVRNYSKHNETQNRSSKDANK
jgi:hypothetical protein